MISSADSADFPRPRCGLVVAYDQQRIIGDAASNSIPWRIPSDERHWLALARDCVVIAGRLTAESLLQIGCFPGKRMVVVSRQHGLSAAAPADYLSIAPSLAEAVSLVGNNEAIIIGGGALYQAALEAGVVDVVWASEVDGDVSGRVATPVLFPALPDGFVATSERFDVTPAADDEFSYRVQVFRRAR